MEFCEASVQQGVRMVALGAQACREQSFPPQSQVHRRAVLYLHRDPDSARMKNNIWRAQEPGRHTLNKT